MPVKVFLRMWDEPFVPIRGRTARPLDPWGIADGRGTGQARPEAALSTSFGFGGMNAALVLRRGGA